MFISDEEGGEDIDYEVIEALEKLDVLTPEEKV